MTTLFINIKSLQYIIVGFLILLPCLTQAEVDPQGSYLDQVNNQQTKQDSLSQSGLTLDVKDSLIVSDTASLQDKAPQYIERDYNHQEQVITGGVIMLCIVAILVTSNNFNPQH